jgi:peptide chain release factor subunit 3
MIGGAAQADVAVLVISARKGEFEAGIGGGQTSEHLLIAKTAGVRFVIIVVNKMDEHDAHNPDPTWSKARFDEIVTKFTPFITNEINFKPNQFCYIPIAALDGGNIKERSPNCPWYKGPTLFEALDQIPPPPRDETDAFRLPVTDRYKAKNVMASGKIEMGVIHEGSKIMVMPSRAHGQIMGIFVEENKIRKGVPGDNIRLSLSGLDISDLAPGSVLCKEGDPCHVSQYAVGKLKLTSGAGNFITKGFSAVCHIHTKVTGVRFARLIKSIAPGKIVTDNPKFVAAGQFVTVVLEFDEPICLERYQDFPQLGRFIIRHNDATIGVGVIESIVNKKAPKEENK